MAKQFEEVWAGRRIEVVWIGDDRPRFMLLNERSADHEERLVEAALNSVQARDKWIFGTLDTGAMLLIGEMFGRIRHVAAGDPLPKKAHATVTFDDGGRLAITVQAWGGF